ncbi:hypothetical protein H7169_01350 [Candidatus Gracilibacteria bacterium]|nr:hypothetical protein [Candidatus Gracilibacteria bacterium]
MFGEKYEPASNPANSDAIPLDGAKVGGDTPLSDLDSSDIDKKQKGKNGVSKLTIEQMGAFVETGKQQLSMFADNNPKVLADKDRGPEAIAEANANIQKEGWPC